MYLLSLAVDNSMEPNYTNVYTDMCTYNLGLVCLNNQQNYSMQGRTKGTQCIPSSIISNRSNL
jgi:hypothetical protein